MPTALPSIPADPIPTAQLEALRDRLDAIRASWLTQLGAPFGTYFHLVAHNEIAAFNADLEIVRAANAERRGYHQSREVVGWPTPVIRTDVLLSQRDLLPVVDIALRVLSGVLERRAQARNVERLFALERQHAVARRTPLRDPQSGSRPPAR